MTARFGNGLAMGALVVVTAFACACGGAPASKQAPVAAPVVSAPEPVVSEPAPVASEPAPGAPEPTPGAPEPVPAEGGIIGAGEPGTIGQGSGTGTGYGVGSGRGGMAGRTSAVPQVRFGQPTANGDLDKAIIRRYIKRNINKITYCYQKQLLTNPALEGTVNTQFFISNTGTVVDSRASGVDAEVSSCIAAVIKAIEFPKPKGGGGVQVNYPFNFRPTGG